MIADAVKAHRFVKALWAACEKEIIMTISEKVAYLKGLAEGLDLDTAKSKEGKLISVMIGILEEIGMSIEDLEENTVALGQKGIQFFLGTVFKYSKKFISSVPSYKAKRQRR